MATKTFAVLNFQDPCQRKKKTMFFLKLLLRIDHTTFCCCLHFVIFCITVSGADCILCGNRIVKFLHQSDCRNVCFATVRNTCTFLYTSLVNLEKFERKIAHRPSPKIVWRRLHIHNPKITESMCL